MVYILPIPNYECVKTWMLFCHDNNHEFFHVWWGITIFYAFPFAFSLDMYVNQIWKRVGEFTAIGWEHEIVYECIYNDFACDVWCVIIRLYEGRKCENLYDNNMHELGPSFYTLVNLFFSYLFSFQCQSIFISPIIICHVSFAWIVNFSKQIHFYLSSSDSRKIVGYC